MFDMDTQIQSNQTEETGARKARLFPYLLVAIGVLILTITVGTGAYYLGRQSVEQSVTRKTTESLSPTTVAISAAISPTAPVSKKILSNREQIKADIESTSSPKVVIEALDISPTDNITVAYLGHNEAWNKFGIYLYDSVTKKTKAVYEVSESIGGRGGYYMDLTALAFSPDGSAFFVNRTGINFPSFVIALADGTILLKSENDSSVGHATWVGTKKLVYLDKDKTYEYNTATKTSVLTKLPIEIFHLRANGSGTKIYAFSTPMQKLQCESFDMHVYSYPEATELKNIPNTSLEAEWTGETSIGFEQITGCEKGPPESMMEYVPVISKQEVVLE